MFKLGHKFQYLDYVDDFVLLSSILHTLVDALGIYVEEVSPLGLTISLMKTNFNVCEMTHLLHIVNIGLAEVEVVIQ